MAANLRVSSTNDQEASHGGHGILQIKDVIDHLSVAGIPSCIVGTRALRYHGALGRAADDWDVCIPTSQLELARQIFDGVSTFRYSTTTDNDDNTLDANPSSYERADPPRRTPNSTRHDYPRFKLKNYNFYFILVPSLDFLPDFIPANLQSDEAKAQPNIEYSPLNEIPYPNRKQLAGTLLFQGNWSDLDDFIDGTNVEVQWGLENLDFEAVSKLQSGLRGGLAMGSSTLKVLSAGELESRWRRDASREEKDKRMGRDKMGRWVTRWLRASSGSERKGVESV